jgi:hypothetical protein
MLIRNMSRVDKKSGCIAGFDDWYWNKYGPDTVWPFGTYKVTRCSQNISALSTNRGTELRVTRSVGRSRVLQFGQLGIGFLRPWFNSRSLYWQPCTLAYLTKSWHEFGKYPFWISGGLLEVLGKLPPPPPESCPTNTGIFLWTCNVTTLIAKFRA